MVCGSAYGSLDPSQLEQRWAPILPHLPPEPPLALPAWLRHVWSLSDERLLLLCGADAYMFLRFLRMGLAVSVHWLLMTHTEACLRASQPPPPPWLPSLCL